MRVLHLLHPAAARPTDYGRRTRALLAELRAQGVQTVHLAAPDGRAIAAPAPDAADGWPHERLHLYRTGAAPHPAWLPASCRGGIDLAATALRLRQVAQLTRPDLVHVHAPCGQALAAWLARLPLLVEAERRGTPAPFLERFACTRADLLAAPSVETRAALRAGGLRPRRIVILPPAADVAAAPCVDPGPPGLDGAPLLAYAGPLDAREGVDLLVTAVTALRRRHRALRLLIAGGGGRTEALEHKIVAAGLRGHVIVTGHIAGRRAADVLARADIAVFPGLPGSGAAYAPSRHLLNAMAQGCAIVASDLACHRDLLVHEHSGILVEAGNGRALVDTLGRLLEQRPRLRSLGMAAAASLGNRHGWGATAARYRRLYETVLAGHPRRRR